MWALEISKGFLCNLCQKKVVTVGNLSRGGNKTFSTGFYFSTKSNWTRYLLEMLFQIAINLEATTYNTLFRCWTWINIYVITWFAENRKRNDCVLKVHKDTSNCWLSVPVWIQNLKMGRYPIEVLCKSAIVQFSWIEFFLHFTQCMKDSKS